MILYSNSDSFGVYSEYNIKIPNNTVYSNFIAEELNARLINKGQTGRCNSAIIRISIRDLIRLRNENPDEKIHALISLATTYRDETWLIENKHPQFNDGHFNTFLKNKQGFYSKDIEEYAKQWLVHYNNEGAITNLLWKTLMLTKTLKSYNITYTIWAGPILGTIKPIGNPDFIKDFSNELKQDPGVLCYETFSFCSWCLDQGFRPFDEKEYGESGRHGPQAHRAFANYLIDNYLGDFVN